MKKTIYSLMIIIIFMISGCSGNGVNPITPQQDKSSGDLVNTDIPLPVKISNYDENGNPIGGISTLGMFYGELNLNTLEASLTPIRTSGASGIKDSIIVDITNFLSLAPCKNCITLKGISLDSYNRPVLSIGISHPFPPGDTSLPPTATNRLDLHVFTVRGFIISNGIIGGGAEIFAGLKQEIPAWRLVNCSGYAGEFDSYWDKILETRATIHPYILHYDDYSTGTFDKSNPNGFANVRLPTGNTVMRMGAFPEDDGNIGYKDYILDIIPSSSEIFRFIYAVTVSYGLSAKGKQQWLNPTYRVPLYCGKPATMVKLASIENFLDDVNPNSYADLTIEVLDINHGVPVGEDIDQMDFDSSVSSILVEAPALKATPFEFTDPASVFLNGNGRNPTNPLTYKVRITNKALAPPGTYTGLIKILDAYPLDANANLGGMNAVPAVNPDVDPRDSLFAVSEWATYAVFKYDVVVGNRPPNCDLKLQSYSILGGSTARAFPGSGTIDPDGSIILYEFDKDYDGETFNVDASNTSGNPVDLGPYDNETGQDMKFTLAMRVTDDHDPAANSICTVELTVVSFSPLIFFDDFTNNDNNWQFDAENFWGIKNGLLGSSAGDGAMDYGLGCYGDDIGVNDRSASSDAIQIPEIPQGYSLVRVTIVHALNTEIFVFNPFDFTDDCDVWIKPSGAEKFKLLTTSGMMYNTNSYTSKDGPSFAGEVGTIPVFGEPFDGVTSIFDSTLLADSIMRIKFRQQTDDGIDNCRGGWWIDSLKVEFIR